MPAVLPLTDICDAFVTAMMTMNVAIAAKIACRLTEMAPVASETAQGATDRTVVAAALAVVAVALRRTLMKQIGAALSLSEREPIVRRRWEIETVNAILTAQCALLGMMIFLMIETNAPAAVQTGPRMMSYHTATSGHHLARDDEETTLTITLAATREIPRYAVSTRPLGL